MQIAGRLEPCSRSDLPSITWMLLGRRWGSHFSSSSAHTRRKLAGTMISKGHSSCSAPCLTQSMCCVSQQCLRATILSDAGTQSQGPSNICCVGGRSPVFHPDYMEVCQRLFRPITHPIVASPAAAKVNDTSDWQFKSSCMHLGHLH